MLSEDMAKRVDIFIDSISGSSDDVMARIDQAIEDFQDGDMWFMSATDFNDNERDILGYIDDAVFNCARCGWCLPICEVAYGDNAELVCADCGPEEGDE